MEETEPPADDTTMRIAHKRLLDRRGADDVCTLPSLPSASTPLPISTPRGTSAAPGKAGSTPREADGDERGKKAKSSHSTHTQSTLTFSPASARPPSLFAQPSPSGNAIAATAARPAPPAPTTTPPTADTRVPTAALSPPSAPDVDPRHTTAAQENARLLALVESLVAQVASLLQQVRVLQQSPTPVPASTSTPSTLPLTTAPATPPQPQPGIPTGPAPTTATGTAPVKASPPKRAPVLRHRAVEPTAALLEAASLPTVSATDLILSIEYAPQSVGFMRRRVFFPNHMTSSRDTCIAVGGALQDPLSLQIAPPRIPAFLMKTKGLSPGSLGLLMDSLPPSSKEFRYLDAWRRAEDCGDQFDPESHGFSDSECVQGWATLLTSSTQAYKPLTNGQPDVEGRHVTIRLGFAHPLITEAARRTFDGHTQRMQGPEADVAMTSRPASPTSSTSSTASDASHSSATPPPPSTAPAAPLSRCARLSSISVSPCHIRYTCTTVSNWPREHPTELCGGDDQLAAFLRLNAPDLRITTTDLFGSTDPSTTVICEPQHLHQLQRLQGKTSPEHGISTPLNLHCDVQLMGLQTCTFCWSPGHGTSRCPHRSSALNPIAPTSHQAACRFCYSFEHHAAACRESGPIACKLCEKQGHASHGCPFFKPRKQPLSVYLKARAAPSPSQSPTQAAPILNAAQRASVKAWQGPQAGATPPPFVPASAPHSAPTQQFVTVDQLQQVLAPITSALQQFMAHFTTLLASHSTAARLSPVFSSPSPLNGQ